ncbi:MAG: energy-coupling factor transport system ATP-binding protein [Clostridia bacterium]|nr:energy-coupling factor transport system ATP-binding protein [Clostridia bacterium]
MMIEIKNLSYRYPTRDDWAIKNITLNIRQGEFVLLTGSTGCGKSTLLKCLNGIIPHESIGEFHGDMIINGMNTREYPIRVLAKQVGLVFQNPDEQIFSTRVMDEVAFGPENLCFPRQEIKERVEWALEKVGMKDYMYTTTNALSGGQKQRVAVASVLALKPRVLVLDEPISQLDPRGAKEVLAVVKKLSDEGMTIVMVEHRIHEVARWADRVVVMDRGEIVLNEPVGKAFKHIALFKKLGLRIPRIVGQQDSLNWLGGHTIRTQTRSNLSDGRKTVEIRDLWFSYENKKSSREKKWILKGVNLDIYEGEMVGIMGNNGSGKSTLMHHLAGIYRPQRGSVKITGKPTKKYNAYKLAGTVGIVFQNPSLMLTCDTVCEEISFGPKNLKMPKEKIARRVTEFLDTMELDSFKDYHPQTLSGGQRLRCAIAAILSMTPQVILLDEPTSGQDIYHIRKLMEVCRQLVKQGRTVIFITHDLEIALEYANRIIVMDDGRISKDCSPAQVVETRVLDEVIGM